ncbi:MAG TPA: N,N-dimethylformamidase beta subunit family domain-containing protein [Ohtaekwangia sp.]|nr:N,N-dimethylformamidase beta subunit family domain-containing protein [Ohtaekwangia sp.]
MKLRNLFIFLAAALFTQCSTTKEATTAEENPIVKENRLEGTTAWLIDVPEKQCEYPDHQWCRRPQVEGYCSQASYKAGDTLNIFVSTEPAKTYTIDLYRMGYYNGKGGRLMKTVGPLQGKSQPVPTAGQNNLIECRWDTAYQMVIPQDWLSGVYLGKLTAQDSSQSYVVFILKDDRKADVMFQCSDMTWQAYNRWPYWHSMYDEGQKPWVNTDGARISFDRPYALYVNLLPSDFNPLSNGGGEFLLWEFPLSFWLEKEGYDVTYISNTDTHADPAGLLRSKAFLSVGHDEYWTPKMFDNVSAARDSGVNILFLSGNSVSGAVYLDPSSDGMPNRITGRMEGDRGDRFFNEEELMGNTSYGVGYADIVCAHTDHWLFAGTGLKDGDTLKHLVGWEYHGYPLRKDSSLIVLGRSRIKPNKFASENAKDHAMTIYRAEKGNFVFNAGTCFWPLPLSTPPGFKNPVNNQGDMGKAVIDFTTDDPAVQRMTKNLLGKALETQR